MMSRQLCFLIILSVVVWSGGLMHRECCTFISTHNFKDVQNYRSDPSHKRRGSSLYGIKGFRSWFESTFPSSMVSADAPVLKREYMKIGEKKIPVPPRIEEDNPNSLPQIYDHVLIDANQYLHSTLRRAYNRNAKKRIKNETIDWDHGLDEETLELSLLFLFRELDHLVTSIAIPRKSVVIALDGSPGAAKLDIQRQRRFSIYRKAETQRKQVSVLKDRGWTDSDFGISTTANIKGVENIIFAKHDREQISLNISPGTTYMDRVTHTILYWAWMSMARRHWPIANPDGKPSHPVKIYISPSNVPGEGEVKLVDWLMRGHNVTNTQDHKSLVKMGESVAIVGGDSDLVLMGMVVPPSVTHNINILLPRELRKTSFYIASMWDTTKMLAKYLTGEEIYGNPNARKSKTRPNNESITLDIMKKAKLDLVLLVILNGNDYLPKVRGVSGGFDSFFASYFKLVKAQLKKNESADPATFLINVDEDNKLSINVPLALTYFQKMLSYEPPEMVRLIEDGTEIDTTQYQLGVLNNLVDAKMLPSPIQIQTIQIGNSSYFESELKQLNSKLKREALKSIESVYGEDVEIVRMTLGEHEFDGKESSTLNATILGENDGHGVIARMIPENDGRSFLFEVPHRQGGSLQETKRRLACLALEEIFGKENMDLFGYDDAIDDSEVGDNDLSNEKTERVHADVESYLAGLLWTLETYQRGYCPDWGYNYGHRAAPTVTEIVDFLESISMRQGSVNLLHRTDLITETSTPPLPDGLAALAALPSQAYHLVPEPYNSLLDPPDAFEEFYRTCIDPMTTVFDMKKFQKECMSALKTLKQQNKQALKLKSKQIKSKTERHIYTGSNHWTVISRSKVPLKHPFTPPRPYTSRAFALRQNRMIKASKLAAATSQHHHKKSRQLKQQKVTTEEVPDTIQLPK